MHKPVSNPEYEKNYGDGEEGEMGVRCWHDDEGSESINVERCTNA